MSLFTLQILFIHVEWSSAFFRVIPCSSVVKMLFFDCGLAAPGSSVQIRVFRGQQSSVWPFVLSSGFWILWLRPRRTKTSVVTDLVPFWPGYLTSHRSKAPALGRSRSCPGSAQDTLLLRAKRGNCGDMGDADSAQNTPLLRAKRGRIACLARFSRLLVAPGFSRGVASDHTDHHFSALQRAFQTALAMCPRAGLKPGQKHAKAR